MGKLVKVIVKGQQYLVTDKDLSTKFSALVAGELIKTAGENGDPDVNYWVPDTDDKAKFDALSELKLINVRGVVTPQVTYYTEEEIAAAQEGDDAYGKTTEDIKSAETAIDAINRVADGGQVVGDVYLIADTAGTGGSNFVESVYVKTASDPDVFSWEVLGVIKQDIDISGKADTAAVKAALDAIKITPVETWTAEEAEAYNTENSLTEGDEGFKTAGDPKGDEYQLEIPNFGIADADTTIGSTVIKAGQIIAL